MKVFRKAILATSCLVAAGLGSAALILQDPMAHKVYESKAYFYSHDENVSDEDLEALTDAVALGTPIPDGFTLEDNSGVVEGVLTGLVVVGTGERQFTVTITDDAEDLDTARLFVGGQQVAIATIANGGVIVRSGKALASMTGYAPPLPPATLKVEWQGQAPVIVRSDEITFY